MGGLTLAHQANALGAAAPKAPPPPNASFEASGTPSLSAVLGEGLLDKNQQLSAKQVKNVAHLPLVGVDLHAGLVSYFPPKPEDPSKGALPVLVGRMKTDVCLKQGETSHKTLRKWLAKSKPFAALQEDSLTTPNSNEKVLLSKPYHLLGLRRQEDAPATKLPFVEDGPAIAEESSEPVVLSVSTLDGSPPTGDDHDRLVYKVKLHSSKKALTVFPEEATQILVDQARQHVVTKSPIDDPEEVGDLPVAVALPAWALHDAAVEALSDASGAGCVFFQRSVCALAGTLLHPGGDKPHPLLERLFAVRKAMQKEFQQEQAKDSAAVFNEDVMVLLMGCTDEGVECTAVQVSAVQDNVCCLFGNYNVISSVSYKSDDPVSMLEKCTKELEASIDSLAPDADGPAGVLFYGTHIDQLKSKWSSIKSKQAEWESLPLFQSKTDAVVMGASVLGGVSHGRASVLVQKGKKMRPELGIRVQNVAPVAVGVQINYFGGAKGKWEEVKPIFDFDRRIPAGPYSIDLKASECVVHREGSGNLDDEAFLKASKDHEGSKGIPKREEAALDLRVQVVQRWTRDGDWKKVGNPLEPLVKTDRDEKRIAIEETTLVLSYGVSGMVSVEMQGDRYVSSTFLGDWWLHLTDRSQRICQSGYGDSTKLNATILLWHCLCDTLLRWIPVQIVLGRSCTRARYQAFAPLLQVCSTRKHSRRRRTQCTIHRVEVSW